MRQGKDKIPLRHAIRVGIIRHYIKRNMYFSPLRPDVAKISADSVIWEVDLGKHLILLLIFRYKKVLVGLFCLPLICFLCQESDQETFVWPSSHGPAAKPLLLHLLYPSLWSSFDISNTIVNCKSSAFLGFLNTYNFV